MKEVRKYFPQLSSPQNRLFRNFKRTVRPERRRVSAEVEGCSTICHHPSTSAPSEPTLRTNGDIYCFQRTSYLPLIFSLGLHGALVSFLFLPSQKIVEKRELTVEVRWEEEAPHAIDPAPDQLLCNRTISPTRREATHTTESPSPRVEQVVPTPEKPSPLGGEGAPQEKQFRNFLKTVRPERRCAAPKSKDTVFCSSFDCGSCGAYAQDERREGRKSISEHSHPNTNTGGKLPPRAPLSVAKMPVQMKYARVSRKPLPKYPWVCRKRGQEGSVSLMVQINGEGRVVSVSLYKSSGHAALDQSAMNAVKAWVFDDPAPQKILSIAFHLKS